MGLDRGMKKADESGEQYGKCREPKGGSTVKVIGHMASCELGADCDETVEVCAVTHVCLAIGVVERPTPITFNDPDFGAVWKADWCP
jgi:hypothetical protein